jgi:uracil-DNA glycosylase family 4
MNNLNQKLESLKWLKEVGIEYYFSDKKDSNISLLSPSLPARTSEAEQSYTKKVIAKSLGGDVATPEGFTRHSQDHHVPPKAGAPRDDAELVNVDSVDKLREAVNNFKGCSLKDFAKNTVFSDGQQSAKIMLIGEAPGAKEDEMGVPFCGESGQLLDIMLSSIGLSRKENIYITNTIFWRPPANRTPTKEEKEICRPFLEKHIALINPKLLICVGSTAVTGLMGDKMNINTARNNIHQYQNQYLSKPINTMAIFHPAYLLRQPGKKKDSWFDLIKIQQFIAENI